MSDQTQDAFETAMADVFEGRECQLGDGPKRLLRAFYERAQTDVGKSAVPGGSRATSVTRAKVGSSVPSFSDLQVGDVFQNAHLRSLRRCRRVIRVVDHDNVETEYVSTRSKRVEQISVYKRETFEDFHNYQYISDPA